MNCANADYLYQTFHFNQAVFLKTPVKAPILAPAPAPAQHALDYVRLGAACTQGQDIVAECVRHAVDSANVFHQVHMETRRCVGSATLT
ncbi:hypothetical protein FRX31_011945 [Thalictrum thalictroides]|uniref:Uncharacterized protein n=1 Tax=Thalictrum thalictroides TaxID=46969 RepID=A0A7J6WM83_THATH|nr:hypothetical protein FRX31_011945 [Thalictrum thalictroides]